MIKEGQDFDNVLLNPEEKALYDAKIAHEANPDRIRLFEKYIQLVIKNNQIDLAKTLISDSPLLQKDCPEAGGVHAHLLYKMKNYDEADVKFDELLEHYPDKHSLRIIYAQTLRKRKKIIKAYKIVRPINIEHLDKKQRIIYDEIVHIYTEVEKKELCPLKDTDDFGILSMKHAVLYFKEHPTAVSDKKNMGKVTLITGSLGPGGAEKQLCLTAIHLNEKMKKKESVQGISINKEVDVLINIFDVDDKGFFLPFLKKHQVNLYQVKDIPSTSIESLAINSSYLMNLLNESPSSVRYGLNRLVEYFKMAQTEIVFVWQDGAILFTALAALVAKVPKIVLNLRGYPPNLRPQIFKPEYYDLYKSLAEIPRVSFVTNTQATAKAYAEWLSISNEKFSVIYNGIVPPSISAQNHEENTWANFVSQTQGATETIGGVFRFETDKRPFLFIRFIKRYLHKYPTARFILVGEGRMREQCTDLATELKIANRILFTGLSQSVGFWLRKMDAMVLMSLYEGLPNVLIEAQYMGVPVVSTPAGGAKECFIEGETGYILNDLKEPDLYEACDKVAKLINQFRSNPELKAKATQFAASSFSVSGMVEQTVKTLCRNTSIQLESSLCEELL